MSKINKPSIGLIPKHIRQHERYIEVCEAISRYYNNGQHIPIKWIEEYNELVKIMKTPADNDNEKRMTEMASFFEDKIEWFCSIKQYGKKVKIKKNEIGRIFGCSVIFNQENE